MKRSGFVFSVLFLILAAPLPLRAQDSPSQLGVLNQKITLLENKVDRLKATQAKIVQKQSGIKAELQTLRVWINRRG